MPILERKLLFHDAMDFVLTTKNLTQNDECINGVIMQSVKIILQHAAFCKTTAIK